MPTTITKTFGTGKDYTTIADLKTYVNALDLIALDQDVKIVFYNDPGTMPLGDFGPLTTDCRTRQVTMYPAPGLGVNELYPTSPFDYGTSGIQLTGTKGSGVMFKPGMRLLNFRLRCQGTGSARAFGTTGVTAGVANNHTSFRFCRVLDTSTVSATASILLGSSSNKGEFTDNLFIKEGMVGNCISSSSGSSGVTDAAVISRNTFIARGAALGTGGKGVSGFYAPAHIANNVFIGFDSPVNATGGTTNSVYITNNYTNLPIAAGETVGITVVTGTNVLVENETSNFRPAVGSPLIGGASSSAVSTLDIVGSNRGATPDVGAWQRTPAATMPAGNVTSITISGTTATISGTTTGTPSSGSASLSVTTTPYNGAVAQAAKAVTLGSGTFTVEFAGLPVGKYTLVMTLTNSGGTADVTNTMGDANVVGAQGSVVTHTLSGQTLRIAGTTTGSPTSASLIIPITGSVSTVGPFDVPLTTGNFDVSVTPPPGTYDPSVLRFTTANGTSLPTAGTSATTIIGISGSPEAPQPGAGVPSTPTGVTAVAGDGHAIVSFNVSSGSWFVVTASTGEATTTTYSPVRVDITNNVAVSFTVVAHTDAGASAPSAASNTVTPVAAAPDAPTGVAAVAPTTGKVVTVTFTPATKSITNPVTSFTVTASTGETASGTASPIAITMPSGFSGTFTVHATNLVGNSPPSAASNTVVTAVRACTITLVSTSGSAVTNLTALKWAWFDQATPGAFLAPTDKGVVETSNAEGVLDILLPNTSLSSGGVGWLVVSDSNGTVDGGYKSFSGPVVVS